jgi:hypothetical protein
MLTQHGLLLPALCRCAMNVGSSRRCASRSVSGSAAIVAGRATSVGDSGAPVTTGESSTAVAILGLCTLSWRAAAAPFSLLRGCVGLPSLGLLVCACGCCILLAGCTCADVHSLSKRCCSNV